MPANMQPSTPPPLLAVHNLSVSVPTQGQFLPLVENVSFTVEAQQIVGLVGESGSGKSVTAMALMGLLDTPGVRITGSALFKGQELIGMPARQIRRLRGREIAMIFQDPMTAFTPVYTIGWQIVEQIRAHERVSRKQAQARAITLLAEMGVPDPAYMAQRYPHQLSGGLRQRAMIAMALSCNPALLIADEPTTALDVTVQAQILELIRGLRSRYGSSVLFITHDMGVVAETCENTLVLYSGRIAETGPTAALFAHPAHPYTAALLASIPPIDGPRPTHLPTIAGAPPPPQERPFGCAFAPRCQFSHAACTLTLPPLSATSPNQLAACVLPAEGRQQLFSQPLSTRTARPSVSGLTQPKAQHTP